MQLSEAIELWLYRVAAIMIGFVFIAIYLFDAMIADWMGEWFFHLTPWAVYSVPAIGMVFFIVRAWLAIWEAGERGQK